MPAVSELGYLILTQPDRIRIRLKRLLRYMRRFGYLRGLRILFKNLASSEGVIRISIPQSKTPIALRANTSDIPTFEQIFIWDDYSFPLPVEPKFIIDGGANVGFASLYFANKFPGVRIIAVEADASNVEMLRENTMSYPNISVIHAGIWHKAAWLEIENPQDAEWAFRVRETEAHEGALRSITIDEILEQSGSASIDILKLDIEGAEKEVFSCNPGWISRVNVLIIELHDYFKPGCSAALNAAVSEYDFKRSQKGEYTILINELGPGAKVKRT